MGEKIKSYKGFNKDLTCKDHQYKIGETYEQEEPIKVCERGFHACEQPIEVFGYYPPASSRYCEVEQSGDINREGSNSKVASSRIKIGAEIGIPGIVKAQIEYVKAHTTTEHTDPKLATAGYAGAATAGNRGAATAGEYGAATAGYAGAATAGEYGAATAGEYGAATAGNRGAATAGNRGAATAGEYGAATAGYAGAATAGYAGAATAGEYGAATAGEYGAATAGYAGAATAGNRGAATAGYAGAATAGEYGAATSRGRSEVGAEGLAVARGNNIKVKGGLGAILVLCEEQEDDFSIKEWAAVLVDGKDVKPDTWYRLNNGQIEEVTEV